MQPMQRKSLFPTHAEQHIAVLCLANVEHSNISCFNQSPAPLLCVVVVIIADTVCVCVCYNSDCADVQAILCLLAW